MKTKRIHIAIDGNEANVEQRVGSNVYAFEILTALHRLLKRNYAVSVTVLLRNEPIADLPRSRKRWQYKVVSPAPLWTQWGLPLHLYLNSKRYSVFFTPGHYAPRMCPIPYVSSVMDLAFIHFPDQFKPRDYLQLKNWTEYSIKNAAAVIAISEYTKSDVIKIYGTPEDTVVVAYPAVDPPRAVLSASKAAPILKELGIEHPYLLHVGTLQPRKNIIRLIEAFEQIKRKSESSTESKSKKSIPNDLLLVLAGKIGWLSQPILDRIKTSPYADSIILTGFIDSQQKHALIKFCETLFQIGLYEGFGIPALEALHLGTIPIVSRTTSLPEVVGEAGLSVDPTSTTQIVSATTKLLTITAKQKARLRRFARKQVNTFDWDESASHILSTLIQVTKQHQIEHE